MNNSTESYTETAVDMQFAQHIIWRANGKLASLSIAVVCYEGLMIVFGVLGNGVVIYVYGVKLSRSVANSYILWLAIGDVIVAPIGILFGMLDARFPMYMGHYDLPCKLVRWIEASNVSRGLLMAFIALDRYLKVCKPMTRTAKYRTCIYIITAYGLGVLTACPNFILHVTKSVETDAIGVVGKDCSIADSVGGTSFPIIFVSFMFAFGLIITTITAVLYVLIAMGICMALETQCHWGNVT
jgi:hypothetical protein